MTLVHNHNGTMNTSTSFSGPAVDPKEGLSTVIAGIHDVGYLKVIGVLLGTSWLLLSTLFRSGNAKSDAPVQGYRSVFEPTFLVQARFVTNAHGIIKAAYAKMKDTPFLLRRYDVDFMVLPMRYLDETRLMPSSKLSGKRALLNNLTPKWTGLGFLLDSHLHVDVIKKKLNPELYAYVEKAKEEMDYGWKLDVPHTDDWTEVFIEGIMRTVVARMTGNVFLGAPTCRDPRWLKISIDFSIDLFMTAFTIKMFPPWMYWLVTWLIPSRHRVYRQVKTARGIVGNLIRQHAAANEKRARGIQVEEQDTILNWMLDHGTPSECAIPEMAARQCVLTLASIHTTATNISNILYDLCAYPEWFPVLRQEIDDIAKELGTPGGDPNVTAREWCTRLDKLDSFFVESQRHSPVILLSPQRLAVEQITLKDGTQIPAGTRIAFANHEYQMDPANVDDPNVFDPMRSYRKRQAGADQRDKHRAGMTNPNNLAFGYGNQACPGRHFAVAEIKLIMARLLYEFEFKFPEGKGRPKSQFINENVFTDQNARILMRKRRL